MIENQTDQPTSHAVSPIGGVISIALPICALGAALLVLVAREKNGTGGDMSGFGALIIGMVGIGASGLLGAAAACCAMARKEKCPKLAQIGLVLNVIVLAIGCSVLLLFHH
jgi:hypothetical protein